MTKVHEFIVFKNIMFQVFRLQNGQDVEYKRGCSNDTCPASAKENGCETVKENGVNVEVHVWC